MFQVVGCRIRKALSVAQGVSPPSPPEPPPAADRVRPARFRHQRRRTFLTVFPSSSPADPAEDSTAASGTCSGAGTGNFSGILTSSSGSASARTTSGPSGSNGRASSGAEAVLVPIHLGNESTLPGTKFRVVIVVANGREEASRYATGTQLRSLPPGLPRSATARATVATVVSGHTAREFKRRAKPLTVGQEAIR